MKIQGTGVSAAQPQVQSAEVSQPKQAVQMQGGQAASNINQDAFVQPVKLPPNIDEIIRRSQVTLDFGDRVNAGNLSSELSSPFNDARLALEKPSVGITQDRDGTYRGPEGQPLVKVELEDGNVAFVDPNTNQYYLSNGDPNVLGVTPALAARDLPAGSQFSNSHFSDADVGALQKQAAEGPVFKRLEGPILRQVPELRQDLPGDISRVNRGPIVG